MEYISSDKIDIFNIYTEANSAYLTVTTFIRHNVHVFYCFSDKDHEIIAH